VLRREDGFTLIELIVVIAIIAVLLLIAIGFMAQARERAGDATARANIRIAVPAIESYRSEEGTYSGMTLATLQASHSPGVQGIVVLSADDAGYCVRAVEAGRSWYLAGPDGDITTTACS
jgi:prepilin-type N-terminal cleavage/methylation domain-containing protein